MIAHPGGLNALGIAGLSFELCGAFLEGCLLRRGRERHREGNRARVRWRQERLERRGTRVEGAVGWKGTQAEERKKMRMKGVSLVSSSTTSA